MALSDELFQSSQYLEQMKEAARVAREQEAQRQYADYRVSVPNLRDVSPPNVIDAARRFGPNYGTTSRAPIGSPYIPGGAPAYGPYTVASEARGEILEAHRLVDQVDHPTAREGILEELRDLLLEKVSRSIEFAEEQRKDLGGSPVELKARIVIPHNNNMGSNLQNALSTLDLLRGSLKPSELKAKPSQLRMAAAFLTAIADAREDA